MRGPVPDLMHHLPPLRRCRAGMLLSLLAAAPLSAQQPRPAVLRGVVYDSLLTSAPLRNAEVFLDGTEFSSVTDSAGRFVFEGLAPGAYRVGVGHPALDSLGFASVRRRIVLEGGETQIQLGPPSDRALREASCPAIAGTEDLGLLMGSVRHAETGAPVGNAEVRAEWSVSTLAVGRKQALAARAASVAVRSDKAGRFQLCGVPTDVAVVVRAADGAAASGQVQADLRGRFFAPLQLEVGTSSDTLRAVLVAGTILGRQGAPLPDAIVRVIGEPVEARTNSEGRYTLVLPRAGTVTLEARAIGFDPQRAIVTARPGAPTSRHFDLQPSAQQLADLDVIADEVGFNRRRTTHPRGIFITPAQIRAMKPERTEDAIRKTTKALFPSGFAVPDMVLLRGGRCVPTFFIDGRRLDASVPALGINPAWSGVDPFAPPTTPDRELGSSLSIYPLGGRPRVPESLWEVGTPFYRYGLPVDPAEVRGIEIYDKSSGIPPEIAAQLFIEPGRQLRELPCAVFIWTWRTVSRPSSQVAVQ